MLAAINAAAAEFSNDAMRKFWVALMTIGYPMGNILAALILSPLLKTHDWRVVFELGAAKEAQDAQATGHVALAIITIFLSWTFVHMIFSLHYAHEFYGERRDGKIGGLDFPGGGHPDYWDFLYFSLVIGMTSQVSDVCVSSRYIRRVVAVHGVLSFFFNLTVLALTVNLVSNLIQ